MTMKRFKPSEVKLVEAEGFRDGTQGVSPEPALKELDAQFAQWQEQEQHDTTQRIKTLEGCVEQLERRKTDAERHWTDLEYETGGMPPGIALALCAVVFSALAVLGEASLLAPVMDGLGIAEPLWQYIMAAVIVITCSGLIEITKRQFQQPPAEIEAAQRPGAGALVKKCFLVALTVLTLLFVSLLGWWRAEEMIFAAAEQGGAWHAFLSQNPTLTRVLITLLTTGLPVFVALAFEWGLGGLRLAWEWRKTRRAYRRYSKALDQTQKRLEAEVEKRDARVKALAKRREEWHQTYLQNHELGRKVGARRLPLWRVLLKIAALALLLTVICLLLEPLMAGYIASGLMRGLLYTCVVTGLGGFYASRVIKAWDRPTPRQLYEQRATVWHAEVSAASTQPAGSGATPQNGARQVNGAGECALLLK
jgi:hypothetical protein